MAGKAAQTSRDIPAKISFLRPDPMMARATRSSSKALTDERSMISTPGSASTSSGERWSPHSVARRRGKDDRQLQCLGSFGQGQHVVFQLTGRIITDAGHEADLMINENERRIFGGEGLVGADLISHYIFLLS